MTQLWEQGLRCQTWSLLLAVDDQAVAVDAQELGTVNCSGKSIVSASKWLSADPLQPASSLLGMRNRTHLDTIPA